MKIKACLRWMILLTGVSAGAAADPAPPSPAWPRTPEEVPHLEPLCETEAERSRTVTLLGSSRDAPELMPYADAARALARSLVASGKHILTGCGAKGIMGAAYDGATALPGMVPGKHCGENRVILVTPPWEKPDLVNARAIGTASSEAERIELFRRCCRTFVVFPGGAATLQEIATLVAFNRYVEDPADRVRILLVDGRFYAGLVAQYREQERMGTLGTSLDGLFEVAEPGEDLTARVQRTLEGPVPAPSRGK